jgi:hypothetical protein
MTINAATIAKLTRRVTKKHAQQIKAEERRVRSRWSRAYTYSDRVNFTDVAARVLPQAYKHASGGGQYPVAKRQLYYAAREEFRKATGREITYQRFASLVVQFVNGNQALTKDWRVTADPRGTLLIPNTFQETRIPCGTVEIDDHLRKIRLENHGYRVPENSPSEWPSIAPGQRYRAVLYIEKEGFEPLLRHARIAERFEIAVLSCKGQSVVAARKFVDTVCRTDGGVPLFVVHDFDVFGFFIGARLTSVSAEAEEQGRVPYRFQNEIDVTDFGLRLVDAQKYNLVDERCKAPDGIDPDLGCTAEEIEFLLSGRRIELNAFTAPQFIEWLEGKLRAAGITERMMPDDNVLQRAFRRAIVTAITSDAMHRVHERALSKATAAKLPRNLAAAVRKRMKNHDEPWDIALARLVDRRFRR